MSLDPVILTEEPVARRIFPIVTAAKIRQRVAPTIQKKGGVGFMADMDDRRR